jgi:hypothetical protein
MQYTIFPCFVFLSLFRLPFILPVLLSPVLVSSLSFSVVVLPSYFFLIRYLLLLHFTCFFLHILFYFLVFFPRYFLPYAILRCSFQSLSLVRVNVDPFVSAPRTSVCTQSPAPIYVLARDDIVDGSTQRKVRTDTAVEIVPSRGHTLMT